MTDRDDAPVEGLDDYLERFMSYPRTVRTDLGAVMRRRRPLRSRFAAPAGVAVLTGALVAVLALALAHHQGAGGAAGENYKGKQLDIVLRTVTGSGDTTTAVGAFPYARYTFYTDEDPPSCVQTVQLQDPSGGYVAGDRTPHVPPANVSPETETTNFALVQTNVPAGDYKVRVTTWAQPCAWHLQEILNSMSSDQVPPPAEKDPAPPKFSAYLFSGQTVDIPVSGLYSSVLQITPISALACRTGAVRATFTNVYGQAEPANGLMTSLPNVTDQGAPVFLAAGMRTLTIQGGGCVAGSLSIKPYLGPTGGGGQGFFAPPSPLPAPYTAAQVATIVLQGRATAACLGATTVGTKNSVTAPGGIVQMTSPYATWTEQSPVTCPPSATPPASAPAGTYVIDLDDCRAPKAETITLTVDPGHPVTVVKTVDSKYGQALAHHATCREQ